MELNTAEGKFMSDAAIGRLCFGATSAREVSVTRGRRLPSVRSAAVRVAPFFYRMLSDGQICLIPYANIRPK